MKTCTKCNQEKPLSEFGKDKTKPDGCYPSCKDCKSKYNKKFREINGDYLNRRKREASAKDPERFKIYNKKSYDKCKNNYTERKMEYAKINKDKCRANVRRYQERHPDLVRERNKKYNPLRSDWKKRNRNKVRFYTAKRRASELCATPKWLSHQQLQQIQEFYNTSNHMTVFHEEKYHVDHIEPLIGKTSCGLHVPWNLQVLPAVVNLSKGNKLNFNLN